jgi:phosphatidylinositol glycan class T
LLRLLPQAANADVSMPYNVLCLSGTVLAVFAGSLLNAMIRRKGKGGEHDAAAFATARRRKFRLVFAAIALLVVVGAVAVHTDPGAAALWEQLVSELTG